MLGCRRVIPFLWFLLSTFALASGDDSVVRTVAPEWANLSEIDLEPASGAGHGSYYYLIVDNQENLDETATYQHLAVHLLSEDGVKSFAQLDFDFQPEYEQLEFHHIRIVRDGMVQERLPEARFEVIRREKDMHNALFDGSMTAFTILEDVRPGDVLSYAFTIRGINPIFAGNQHGFIRLGFSKPIRLMRRRLLWDSKKMNLRWRTLGSVSHAPEFHAGTPLNEVEWTNYELSTVDIEKDTPGYFFDYPLLTWSSYSDWTDFCGWACKVYPDPGQLPGEMVSICNEIRGSSGSPEEEIANTLRWVQRNVRYLV